jgi:anti-sigma factor ChrR (cupin superfamily)
MDTSDAFSAVAVNDVPPVEVGPGCRRRDLPSRGGVRFWIVEMDPGAQWPFVDRHGPGGEDVYVLSGDLIDNAGTFGPGSFLTFPPESAHRPRTETGVVLFGVNMQR